MSFTLEQEAWLLDLETTDACQGKLRLRSKGDCFCCLGRACVVLGIEARTQDSMYYYGSSDSVLKDYRRLHLRSEFGSLREPYTRNRRVYASLIDMNDSGEYDFKAIAAFIRANPWQVFTNFERPA